MVTFNFTYQPGTTLQQMIGFEIAGRLWSKYFTDPVTVNIHVGTSNLAQGLLAGALPGYKTAVPYTGYETNGLRSYIQNDAQSQDDWTAYDSSIANSDNFGVFLSYNSSGQVLAGAGSEIGTSVAVPRANAKALNVPLENAAALDGYIIVNQTVKNAAGQVVPWNYNYSSATVPSNTIDFVSVAAHEIGHVLGFISGVDRPWKFTIAEAFSLSFTELSPLLLERINESTPLDLFRRVNLSDVTSNVVRDRSIGGSPFLALSDDTSTALGYFATGKDKSQGGNGFQASHWLGDGTSSGLMNATLGTGVRAKFADLDLRTFDLIGWDRSTATASTSLSWSTLLTQTKQALATRIGKTTTWLDSNTTTAANLLSQDRLTDVNALANANPDIYEGKTNKPTTSWQELFSLLSEQGLFDSLESEQSNLPTQATKGADVLAGSTKDDLLAGHRGNDQLIGFRGSDQLAGNRGQDVLFGNLGRDQISGGAGNDLLVGGRGSDRLVGGSGKDIFVIQNQFGLDEVMDFVDGQDQLLLDQGLQFGQLTITQQGNDTLIRLEQTPLMLLKGVSADLITAADFA